METLHNLSTVIAYIFPQQVNSCWIKHWECGKMYLHAIPCSKVTVDKLLISKVFHSLCNVSAKPQQMHHGENLGRSSELCGYCNQ